MKIRPMGAGRTDTLTDGWIDRHDEINSRFRYFAKSPTNRKKMTQCISYLWTSRKSTIRLGGRSVIFSLRSVSQ